MTIVAGIVTPTGCYIGSDSMSSDGDLYTVSATPKIMRVGDTLIGFAGSWRAGQQFFDHVRKNETMTLEQMVDFETTETDFNLLVIKDREVYEVSQDRALIKSVKTRGVAYAAIGSGSAVCLGALAYARPKLDKVALRRALTVTAQHVTTVCAPMTVMSVLEQR